MNDQREELYQMAKRIHEWDLTGLASEMPNLDMFVWGMWIGDLKSISARVKQLNKIDKKNIVHYANVEELTLEEAEVEWKKRPKIFLFNKSESQVFKSDRTYFKATIIGPKVSHPFELPPSPLASTSAVTATTFTKDGIQTDYSTFTNGKEDTEPKDHLLIIPGLTTGEPQSLAAIQKQLLGFPLSHYIIAKIVEEIDNRMSRADRIQIEIREEMRLIQLNEKPDYTKLSRLTYEWTMAKGEEI